MTDTIGAPDPHQPWIDPATGKPTMYFFAIVEDLLAGSSTNSIGTVLSGQTSTQAQVDGIVAGEQEQAAEDVATSFTVTVPDTTVSGVGDGTVTTNTISISVSGGTAPYSIAWSASSGVAVTANSVSTLSADGSFDVSFTRELEAGDYFYCTQKVTITDSAGTPLVSEAVVNLTLLSVEFDSNGIGGA